MGKGSKTRRERGRARARERAEAVREAKRSEARGDAAGSEAAGSEVPLGGRIWSVVGPSRPLLLVDTAVVAALGLLAAWATPNAARTVMGRRELWAFMMAVCGAWLALGVVAALMHFYYVGTGQVGRKAFGKETERQSLFLWSVIVFVSTLALAVNLAA